MITYVRLIWFYDNMMYMYIYIYIYIYIIYYDLFDVCIIHLQKREAGRIYVGTFWLLSMVVFSEGASFAGWLESNNLTWSNLTRLSVWEPRVHRFKFQSYPLPKSCALPWILPFPCCVSLKRCFRSFKSSKLRQIMPSENAIAGCLGKCRHLGVIEDSQHQTIHWRQVFSSS